MASHLEDTMERVTENHGKKRKIVSSTIIMLTIGVGNWNSNLLFSALRHPSD